MHGCDFVAKKGVLEALYSLPLQHKLFITMADYLLRLDRNVVTVGKLTEQDPLEETRYWLTKTPSERLAALELLRMRLADYDNATARLQRFYTVTERASR